MSVFIITETTTVATLKEQFERAFGGRLRVYKRRLIAEDDELLVSLGAITGRLECSEASTVEAFCNDFLSTLNLKVKVWPKDYWVEVLPEITLSMLQYLPKQATKSTLSDFWHSVLKEARVLVISETTTVATLKEQFERAFGGRLRVYKGRLIAEDNELLLSLGATTGRLECSEDYTVEAFCNDFLSTLNLKVKVWTKDYWVEVLPEITLSMLQYLPKQATKSTLSDFWHSVLKEARVLVISETTTVATLKEQFERAFGGGLRVYRGRLIAEDDELLLSLGATTGRLECSEASTVEAFCNDFLSTLNLKVKVWTKDYWVEVLPEITLSMLQDLPKQATKEDLKAFIDKCSSATMPD